MALLAVAVLVGVAGLLLTLVGLEAPAATLRSTFTGWVDALFAPTALPTTIPRLVLFVLVVGVAALAFNLAWSTVRAHVHRRAKQSILSRLLGSPLTTSQLFASSLAELWNLIRGAAPIAAPEPNDLARRYIELLSDNLGQP